jgi:hypothetical protein
MTSAPIDSSSAITDFLNRALADGALAVGELEVRARALGLLGERQQIQHAKAFKKAKKALGIRSARDGFGSGGRWAWVMPPKGAQIAIAPIAKLDLDTKAQDAVRNEKPQDRRPAGSESRCVVRQWIDGVQRLDYDRSPSAVPIVRWQQFLGDCHSFLNSSENWAERAAALDWNALTLFGCHRIRPLDHLGSAGLLWAINGGRLCDLYRDWAAIERAADRSRRVYHRRAQDMANVTLPWRSGSWA